MHFVYFFLKIITSFTSKIDLVITFRPCGREVAGLSSKAGMNV